MTGTRPFGEPHHFETVAAAAMVQRGFPRQGANCFAADALT
jgi:hypothetical protein